MLQGPRQLVQGRNGAGPDFLGAHVVPSEYEGRSDDYVDLV
jgi:hypothetical protein